MKSHYYIGTLNLSTLKSHNDVLLFLDIHLLVLVFSPMDDISGDHVTSECKHMKQLDGLEFIFK